MARALSMTGILLLLGGLFVTSVNFYLSWIRVPLMRRLRGGGDVPWVSGIPLAGSGALWLSAALLPTGSLAIPVALIASVFDTGGVHWFVGSIAWRYFRGTK